MHPHPASFGIVACFSSFLLSYPPFKHQWMIDRTLVVHVRRRILARQPWSNWETPQASDRCALPYSPKTCSRPVFLSYRSLCYIAPNAIRHSYTINDDRNASLPRRRRRDSSNGTSAPGTRISPFETANIATRFVIPYGSMPPTSAIATTTIMATVRSASA